MIKVWNWVKSHIFAISLVVGGILDQTTDLLAQFLLEINAPSWSATLLRILIISFGAIRLYLAKPFKNNTTSRDEDIGGGGIKNPPPPEPKP